MRFVRLAVLLAAVAGGADRAAAQTLGTTGGSTTAGTGSTGTGTSGGGTGGTSGSTESAFVPTPDIAGAQVTGTVLNATSAATGGTLDTSNFLGGTFSNPYYQGRYNNTTGAAGGFGQVLFGTAAGGSGAANTTTGARTGTTNTRAATAGVGGANPFGTSASPFGTATAAGGGRAIQGGGLAPRAGGFGGGAAASQYGGQVIPLPRNIAYQAVLRFPTPVVAPAERLADVQAVFARSTQFATPAGVTVVADGPAFVLRGRVGSEDEARLAEGMVRLSPGVREVRNELTFPRQ